MKAEQLNAAKYAVNEQIAELEDWLGRDIEDGLSPEITAAKKKILAGQRAALQALEEIPPTPGDLDTTLSQALTAENAVGIYKQALSMARRYDAVKKSALAVTQSTFADGEMKKITTFGNCGWTQPKPRVALDEAAWQEAVKKDPELRKIEERARGASEALATVQLGYMTTSTPKPRFYIK
jgi:hypothetical protein